MITQTSRMTSHSGVKLVFRETSVTNIASVNIWIQRSGGRFDLDHLCEHLIAFKLRESCKEKFSGVYGAHMEDDFMCIFARIHKSAIVEFVEVTTQCFYVDSFYFSSSRIEKEIGIITNEIKQAGGIYNKTNKELGLIKQHNLSNITEEMVRSRVQDFSISGKWTLDVLSTKLDSISIDALQASADTNLIYGARINVIRDNIISSSVVATDPEKSLIALQFKFKLPQNLDYNAMLLFSRLITSSSPISLSRQLRDAGMTYSINRSFSLLNGGGRHTLYIRTKPETLIEAKEYVTTFFEQGSPFPESYYIDAINESEILQLIAMENLGVLAGRLGSLEQAYNKPCGVEEMLYGLSSDMSGFYHDTYETVYFNQELKEIQL
jgi:hypothetical protein